MKGFLLCFIFCFPYFVNAQLTPIDLMNKYGETVDKESVYMQTSNPFYEPNERIVISIYILNDFDKTYSKKSQQVNISLINPDGTVKESKLILYNRDVLVTTLLLGEKSGIYKLRLQTDYGGFIDPDFFYTLDVQVQSVVDSDLFIDTKYDQFNYSAGDTVAISGEVKRLNGDVMSRTPLMIECLLNGKVHSTHHTTTDRYGKYNYEMILPDSIQAAFASLNLSVMDKGKMVSRYKPLPYRSGVFNVVFLPEGGWLVEGIESVLAFKAIDVFGKGVDISGEILDENGDSICSFSSGHNGMGKCLFKPLKGHRYKAWVKSGTSHMWVDLPEIKPNGLVVTVDGTHFKTLKLNLVSTESKIYHVALRKADKVIELVTTSEGFNHKIQFHLQNASMGIHEVSVFDQKWQLLAQRRVFLRPDRKINVDLSFEDSTYSTKSTVKCKVKLTDESGKPIQGAFVLSVFDKQLSRFAEDNKENILSGLLLSNEIKGKVEQPAYYFKDLSSERLMHLDLLMLTNAWTRVNWYNDLRSDSTYLRAVKFNQSTHVLRGCIKESLTLRRLRWGKVKLICRNNGQVIPITENRCFYIWDIPQGESLNFKLKYKNRYIQRFSLQPWFESDLTEIKSIGTRYIAIQKKIDTPGIGFVYPQYDSKIDNLVKQSQYNDYFSTNLSKDKLKLEVVNGNSEESLKLRNKGFADDGGMFGRGSRIDGAAVYIDGVRVSNSRLSQNSSDDYYGFYRKFYIETYDRFYRQRLMNERDYQFFQYFLWDHNVYFSESVQTDHDGIAEIEFISKNSNATYECVVDAIDNNGHIGTATKYISVKKSIELSLKSPNEVFENDRIVLPLQIVSGLDSSIAVNLICRLVSTDTFKYRVYLLDTNIQIKREGTFQHSIELNGLKCGNYQIFMRVEGGGQIEYCSNNFHVNQSYSLKTIGFASVKDSIRYDFVSKNSVRSDELKLNLELLLPNESILTKAVSGIISEPHGCFEQVSSSNYPNLLAYKYFLCSKDSLNREKNSSYKALLLNGYRKLIAYETKGGGFEWYGRNPPHEGLTAYGLLQFYELEKLGIKVDKEINQRTINWLLSRFNDDGSIKVNAGKYGFSGASTLVTTAYVTWVLSAVSDIDLSLQLAYIEREHDKKFDVYINNLIAAIYYNRKSISTAKLVLARSIASIRESNYSKINSDHSIVRSSGNSLDVELMGMAAFFAFEMNAFENERNAIVDVIFRSMEKNGTIGNTQSTVWALKALQYWMLNVNNKFKEIYDLNGSFSARLTINDKPIDIHELNFNDKKLSILLPNDLLEKGNNTILFESNGLRQQMLSFELTWIEEFESDSMSELFLSLENIPTDIRVGRVVQLDYQLQNRGKTALPQSVVVISFVGGLELIPEQLMMLVDKGFCDYYEIVNGNLIVYFAELGPGEIRNIPVTFKALFEGEYTMSQSKAYLYYQPEVCAYLGKLKLNIND